MLRLVIDANVFLDFYRMTNDDLEELRKLLVLIEQGTVELCLTQQLLDEVRRNREKVIQDSIKNAETAKLPSAFPHIIRNYESFQKLTEARQTYEKILRELVREAKEAAIERKLHADELLDLLFAKGKVLPTSPDAMDRAVARMNQGNPPGKDGSYGDAITWETLLERWSSFDDLHLVTRDQDYVSALSPDRLQQFLQDEWHGKVWSSVSIYKDLSTFFATHYPHIKLSKELVHEEAVLRLVNSWSFQATHDAIAAMPNVADLSDYQISRITEAAVANNQITWILGDQDVFDFYEGVMRSRGPAVSDDIRIELSSALDDIRSDRSKELDW